MDSIVLLIDKYECRSNELKKEIDNLWGTYDLRIKDMRVKRLLICDFIEDLKFIRDSYKAKE